MLRGARIDLETSANGLRALVSVYERDLRAKELSDAAIAAVNTVVRSLEGAMGKTATEVAKRFASRHNKTYFPLAGDPAQFRALFTKNFPNVRDPDSLLRAAFERHQPYRPGHAALAHLKALYRENHHHDFTLQEHRETKSLDIRIGGRTFMTLGSHGMTMGGEPEWRGIPVGMVTGPTFDIPANAVPMNELFVAAITRNEDGSVEVYINGKKVGQSPAGLQAIDRTFIDWYFVRPPVSVLATLVDLHNLCGLACADISSTAGL
jgi:hypothetical protein